MQCPSAGESGLYTSVLVHCQSAYVFGSPFNLFVLYDFSRIVACSMFLLVQYPGVDRSTESVLKTAEYVFIITNLFMTNRRGFTLGKRVGQNRVTCFSPYGVANCDKPPIFISSYRLNAWAHACVDTLLSYTGIKAWRDELKFNELVRTCLPLF